jgi:hypothetical protein
MGDAAIALGWRVHAWTAVVVAVRGSASSPEVVHREEVTLIDDPSVQEPYHVACGLPRDEVPALIESVGKAAADAAASAVRGFASSLGPVAAVGVVGGDRRLPELGKILMAHARLHAAERDLYERAIIRGAADAGCAVTTIPATGKLFDEASEQLGVAVGPTLTALGKAIGPPWTKDHREAAAVALVALNAVRSR